MQLVIVHQEFRSMWTYDKGNFPTFGIKKSRQIEFFFGNIESIVEVLDIVILGKFVIINEVRSGEEKNPLSYSKNHYHKRI